MSSWVIAQIKELNMPQWGEMIEQVDRWAKQPSQVACVLENLKWWEVWSRHYTCGHKAKDITPSIALRREAWEEEALDDSPWERAIVSQMNIGTVSKASLGKLLRDGVELFWVHRYDLELNWTELIKELAHIFFL